MLYKYDFEIHPICLKNSLLQGSEYISTKCAIEFRNYSQQGLLNHQNVYKKKELKVNTCQVTNDIKIRR
jgi:hypothetical protein